jgi:hypothetical protein
MKIDVSKINRLVVKDENGTVILRCDIALLQTLGDTITIEADIE